MTHEAKVHELQKKIQAIAIEADDLERQSLHKERFEVCKLFLWHAAAQLDHEFARKLIGK